MKFYPEYKLLETDGNEFRVRKQNDNFNYKSLKNEQKLLFYLGNSIVVNVLKELIIDLENIL